LFRGLGQRGAVGKIAPSCPHRCPSPYRKVALTMLGPEGSARNLGGVDATVDTARKGDRTGKRCDIIGIRGGLMFDDSLTATQPARRETADNTTKHNTAYVWGL